MSRLFLLGCAILVIGATTTAAPPVKGPAKKIKPGEVVVPVGPGEQRLIFGELISLDLKTRTGSFRNENNDEVTPFTVLPYAELQYHAASGDLQDFRVGERALFRLHLDENGKWTWLTYIGDDLSFLANHDSYYWVEALDPAAGRITFTRGNADKTKVGENGVMGTDAATRFWKQGKPASFKDLKVGDKMRAETRGIGKGKERACWEVTLDGESLKKLQEDQKAVHLKRLETEGLAGYVDARDGKVARLTLFHETRLVAMDLKPGQKVRLAPAGVDRKPIATPIAGKLTEIKKAKKLYKLTVTLDAANDGIAPRGLVRVWLDP